MASTFPRKHTGGWFQCNPKKKLRGCICRPLLNLGYSDPFLPHAFVKACHTPTRRCMPDHSGDVALTQSDRTSAFVWIHWPIAVGTHFAQKLYNTGYSCLVSQNYTEIKIWSKCIIWFDWIYLGWFRENLFGTWGNFLTILKVFLLSHYS